MNINITNFKLGIAMPTSFSSIWTNTFDSFVCAKKPNFVWIRKYNGFIDILREDSIIEAMDIGCSHLFMFDSDMVLHPDVIPKLIKNDLDICGALCFQRYPPFHPVMFKVWKGDINGDLSQLQFQILTEWHEDIIEVDAIGTGIIMFKMNIFDKLDIPYFERIIKNKEKEMYFGEDLSFCIKAKRKGFKIFVDTTVPCGHLCLHNINKEDFELAKILENNNKLRKENK